MEREEKQRERRRRRRKKRGVIEERGLEPSQSGDSQIEKEKVETKGRTRGK